MTHNFYLIHKGNGTFKMELLLILSHFFLWIYFYILSPLDHYMEPKIVVKEIMYFS